MESLPRAQAHIQRSDPIYLILQGREGDLRAADTATWLARDNRVEFTAVEHAIEYVEPAPSKIDELVEVFGRVCNALCIFVKGHFDPLGFFIG